MTVSFRHLLCTALTAPFLLVVASTQPALADMTDKMHKADAMKPMVDKADNVMAGDLVISDAWTRQAPPAATVLGGYATITNKGKSADRLTGASAGFANHVEIHTMSMKDGVMTMKEVAGGLEIAPGKTVELKPGSFHIMFMQATSPKAGETVDVTLQFEKAGSVVVQMPVAPIGAGSPPAMEHGTHHDMKHMKKGG